jgi:hypothetical protein
MKEERGGLKQEGKGRQRGKANQSRDETETTRQPGLKQLRGTTKGQERRHDTAFTS